jgi:hypothetical protein
MATTFSLNIGQAEFDEQRALLERLIGLLHAGQPAKVEPSDTNSLDAFVGLQNLCDAITDQMEVTQYTLSFTVDVCYTVDIAGEQATADHKARALGEELHLLIRQTEAIAGRKATLEPRAAHIEATDTDPQTGGIVGLRVLE